MTIRRFAEGQLAFELDLDDVANDAQERAISLEEARQISETARLAFEDTTPVQRKKTAWYEEYLRLRRLGWPWRVAAYIGWASSPKVDRWPATLQELATFVLGLTGPRTIYNWRKRFPSIDTMVAILQAEPLFEHRRDVIEAMIASASDPDYKGHNDRKLFFEMIGDYVPRSQLKLDATGKAKDLSELSDDELDALLGDQVLGQEPGSISIEDQEPTEDDDGSADD